jgi:hypothetical protein
VVAAAAAAVVVVVVICTSMYLLGTDKCKEMFVTMHKSMRPIVRSRCRWRDNIARILTKVGVTAYNTFKCSAVKEKAICT